MSTHNIFTHITNLFKTCPYKIIGNKIHFTKNLDEPIENYYHLIRNYSTVHFSHCKQHVILTKNIVHLIVECSSFNPTSIFPKNILSVTMDLTGDSDHIPRYNKNMIYMNWERFWVGPPMPLSKNIITLIDHSFSDKYVLNSKLVVLNCRNAHALTHGVLPKKIRRLTIFVHHFDIMSKINIPPNLKFLRLDKSHGKHTFFHLLTPIEKPLDTIIITAPNTCPNEYVVECSHIISKHLYVPTNTELFNVSCKTRTYFDKCCMDGREFTYYVRNRLLVGVVFIAMFEYLFAIGIISYTFSMSIFYEMVSENARDVLYRILVLFAGGLFVYIHKVKAYKR